MSFFYKSAIGSKHLNTIGAPVADVDQAITGWFSAVHGANELLWEWLKRVIGDTFIDWLVAVGSPEALESTCRHVDYCNTLVAVAIGEIGFAGSLVDSNLGYPAK